MISPKFVSIAREVVRFIRNGGKLGYTHLYKDGHCCPLGAVCINAGYKNGNHDDCTYPSWYDEWYDFAFKKTKLTTSFFDGFDECDYDSDITTEKLSKYSEDFVIGYKLAQFCKKRNWL